MRGKRARLIRKQAVSQSGNAEWPQRSVKSIARRLKKNYTRKK